MHTSVMNALGVRGGAAAALNEVLEITIDDVVQHLTARPRPDIEGTCRDRLHALTRIVDKMWAGAAAARAAPESNTSDAPGAFAVELPPCPPRLAAALPTLLRFAAVCYNEGARPGYNAAAETMAWTLIFRLLIWVTVWAPGTVAEVEAQMYFVLHAARRELQRQSQAVGAFAAGAPAWLYTPGSPHGAPLEGETCIWVAALLLLKLPRPSLNALLSPLGGVARESAPCVRMLRQVAVDVVAFAALRVRRDVMQSEDAALDVFPLPSLDAIPAPAAPRRAVKVVHEALWVFRGAVRACIAAVDDGRPSALPVAGRLFYDYNGRTMSAASGAPSMASSFLFEDPDDDDDPTYDLDDDIHPPRAGGSVDESVLMSGGMMERPDGLNASRYGGLASSVRSHAHVNRNASAIYGQGQFQDPAEVRALRERRAAYRSYCCNGAWLSALRLLSAVAQTSLFELFALRPDADSNAGTAVSSAEVERLQARGLFQPMVSPAGAAADPARPWLEEDEDYGTSLAMLVHALVAPRVYNRIVLASVSQLTRCAVVLCAVDGLSRHVRGRAPHPHIGTAAMQLLAAGVHHPRHGLVERSLAAAVAEVHMAHKAVSQRVLVSVGDVGCIVSRLLEVFTDFAAALRGAYPALFVPGHAYYEGWQRVLRVVTWMSDACVPDRPRRGEPLWQLALYYMRLGRVDSATAEAPTSRGVELDGRPGAMAQPPQKLTVAAAGVRRFAQAPPAADEYFALRSTLDEYMLGPLAAAPVVTPSGGVRPPRGAAHTQSDFTAALRWAGPTTWAEAADRVEAANGGALAAARAAAAEGRVAPIEAPRGGALQRFLALQRGALDAKWGAVAALAGDHTEPARIAALVAEGRTLHALVGAGRTSLATSVQAFRPDPALAASLSFLDDIMRWCLENGAADTAAEYAEAYVGVVESIGGPSVVAASISEGALRLYASEGRRRTALMFGMKAYRLFAADACDLIEAARVHLSACELLALNTR